MNDVYIYALLDPDDGEIRYIGKTVNPTRRYYAHVGRKDVGVHRVNWVNSLLDKGKKPVMEIVEITDEENWESREKHYISIAMSIGYRLTNMESGGISGKEFFEDRKEGIRHPKSISPETRAAMAERCRKLSSNPEIVAKRRATMMGHLVSEETRRKISEVNTGKKRSEEFGKQCSMRCAGRKHSPETIEKIKEVTIFSDPEFKKRNSERMRGRVFTDEWRRKLSEKAKLRGNNRGKWKKNDE